MRILHVVQDFVDTNARGSQLYTYHLCNAQAAKHDVGVMYCRFDGTCELRTGNAEKFVTYSIGRVRDDSFQSTVVNYRDRWADRAFAEILRQFRPDVVHVQHLALLSMDLPTIAKTFGTRVVYALHDFWLICPQFFLMDHKAGLCWTIDRGKCFQCCLSNGGRPVPKSKPVRWALSSLKRRAELSYRLRWHRPRAVARVWRDVDLFISPSQHLRDRFIQEGMPADKIVYCDNGFKYDASARPAKPNNSNRLRFGFIGTIARYKGIDLLLEAFRGIDAAELHIYGKVNQPDYVENAATTPSIVFKGELSEEDKPAAFAELDVLIVPSIVMENSPLTIHEAFIYGVPVVTADVGGMRELVDHGTNGLHFKVGDSLDLRRRIVQLIKDPEEVTRLSAGMPRIKTIEENAREIEAMYERLLGCPKDK